ncbi:MAG TPA: thioredoxin domain-containing protein, partial [Desulfobacterales bacterium]|nr:thioredoxin domain-containing protein [Desulfobacterales bacterium]
MCAKSPNRLIGEKSPYLLQHAYNPVDWYPWGEDAFEKARNEDKPIFLSIGYSTCHWCHIMERESFEDEKVARLLNETFVCIKVDREERPDIDHVYMTVCQLITQSGGWPLTILLTPSQEPFFAATYIPKKSSFGRIGILDLTVRVKELWSKRRSEVLKSSKKIMEALKTLEKTKAGPYMDANIFDKAFQDLSKSYDPEWGGFSPAPKFPSPHNIKFLLRHWKRTQKKESLEMVEKTLRCMRLGGIYDHLGYGFHRYSTDKQWLVPHFEKML